MPALSTQSTGTSQSSSAVHHPMARRAATTLALATLATAFAPMPATARGAPMRAAFYDLADVANDGSEVAFSQFEGKVCYAVNVASA